MVFNSLNEFSIYNETEKKLKKEMKCIKKIIKYALKYENIENASLCLILVNDDRIKEINKNYRNIDRPTDVISFALEDNKDNFYLNKRVLGDIYISVDTAIKAAKEYNHSLIRELCFLSVHGLLHLLGYDHMKKEDEKIMFEKQELILNGKRFSNLQKK